MTKKIIIAVVSVVLVLGLMYYFIIYKGSASTGTPAAAGADPSQGRPPYYSKATYDVLASGTLSGTALQQFGVSATSDIPKWRELNTEEWGSVYGTFAWELGYDMHSPPAGMPGMDSVLQWYKGMNLDPVHLQGYVILFKSDIVQFSQKAKQYAYPFTEVSAGYFLATA